jgi:microcystin-dependent protein
MVNPKAMNASLIGSVGKGEPHNNQMPYLAVTICMALAGEFPQRG